MDSLRKLLVLGTNELVRAKHIDLNGDTDVEGVIDATLAGRPAKIMWRGIGYGEIQISVWWDYDHGSHPQANLQGNRRESFNTAAPLAKRQHYPKFVGAVAAGWLERRKGKYLQGKGGRQGIFESYLRRDAQAALKALPDPKPTGFEAEGRVHL
jgi:hypothetical protein